MRNILRCIACMLRREDGAVSVFMIILVAGLLFFHAMLIDYARIMAADRMIEQSLQASLRSVLSSYDTKLFEQYGLFAIGKQDVERLFHRILADNLHSQQLSGAFHFVEPILAEHKVQISHPLSDLDVFANQLKDEMRTHHDEESAATIQAFRKSIPILREVFSSYTASNLTESRNLNQMKEQTLTSASSQSMQDMINTSIKNLKVMMGNAENEVQPTQAQWMTSYVFSHYRTLDPSILSENPWDFAKLSVDASIFSYKDKRVARLFDIRQQQTEYILYGSEEAEVNISSSLQDMVSFRLAMNIAASIMQSSATASLSESAVWTAVQWTEEDMRQLWSGAGVPMFRAGSSTSAKLMELCPCPALRLRQYLELIHQFQSQDSMALVKRMMSLLELEGVQVKEKSTGLRGEVTASISLWFLPGVMKWLGIAGDKEGKVIGNRYYITKHAAAAY